MLKSLYDEIHELVKLKDSPGGPGIAILPLIEQDLGKNRFTKYY
jgi:hypothetical protein